MGKITIDALGKKGEPRSRSSVVANTIALSLVKEARPVWINMVQSISRSLGKKGGIRRRSDRGEISIVALGRWGGLLNVARRLRMLPSLPNTFYLRRSDPRIAACGPNSPA